MRITQLLDGLLIETDRTWLDIEHRLRQDPGDRHLRARAIAHLVRSGQVKEQDVHRLRKTVAALRRQLTAISRHASLREMPDEVNASFRGRRKLQRRNPLRVPIPLSKGRVGYEELARIKEGGGTVDDLRVVIDATGKFSTYVREFLRGVSQLDGAGRAKTHASFTLLGRLDRTLAYLSNVQGRLARRVTTAYSSGDKAVVDAVREVASHAFAVFIDEIAEGQAHPGNRPYLDFVGMAGSPSHEVAVARIKKAMRRVRSTRRLDAMRKTIESLYISMQLYVRWFEGATTQMFNYWSMAPDEYFLDVKALRNFMRDTWRPAVSELNELLGTTFEIPRPPNLVAYKRATRERYGTDE